MNAPAQAHPLDESLHFFAQGTIADEQEMDIRSHPGERGGRLQPKERPLFRPEPEYPTYNGGTARDSQRFPITSDGLF